MRVWQNAMIGSMHCLRRDPINKADSWHAGQDELEDHAYYLS